MTVKPFPRALMCYKKADRCGRANAHTGPNQHTAVGGQCNGWGVRAMAGSAQVLALFPSDTLRLTADGRIVDFLNDTVTRPNAPEERVRQDYARKLHHEYGYAKETMVFGRGWVK